MNPDVARIISAYQHAESAPKAVTRWEQQANAAGTDQAAQTQLIYQLLVEVRVIKLLLFWVLVIVPIIGVILAVVLAGSSSGF